MMPEIFKNKDIMTQDDITALQLASQFSQTAQLVKMRRLEESKIPTGTLTLARTLTDETTRIPLSPPWISFSLVNDGPGSIAVSINKESELLPDVGTIASTETYSADMTYPIIETIYLKAASGTSASVRIYGKVGKPKYEV